MISDFVALRAQRPVATPDRRLRVAAGDDVDLLVGAVEAEPRATRDVLLFFHGAGAHMGAGYLHLARDLYELGAGAILVPDLRGHGRSGGQRGEAATPARIWEDVDALVSLSLARYPHARLHLGGHSLGASLCLNWMCQGEGVRSRLREQVTSLQLVAPYTGSAGSMRPPAAGEVPFILHRPDGGVAFGYGDAVAARAGLVQQYGRALFTALAPTDFAAQVNHVLRHTTLGVNVLAPRGDELLDADALDELLAPLRVQWRTRLHLDLALRGGHLSTLYFSAGALTASMQRLKALCTEPAQ